MNGGSPEEMLGDPFPVPVAGDDSARFLRRRGWNPDDPHSREAFHWGRFTSGSPTRALWLLLAPFAILNLAGFTLLPTAKDKDSVPFVRLVRLVLRLLGLALTGTLVLAVARTSMDLVMHQCAAAPLCVDRNRWLDPVRGAGDGLRLLLGVVPPLVVILLLGMFGRKSFLYEPPGRPADQKNNDTLGDRGFWHTTSAPLRSAHVMAACAVLGSLCVAYLGGERTGEPVQVAGPVGWVGFIAFAALFAVAVVVVAVPHRFVDPAQPRVAERRMMVGEIGAVLVVLVAAVVCAVLTAAGQPLASVGQQSPGRPPLPGFEIAAVIVLCVFSALLGLMVLGCAVLRCRYEPPEDMPSAFQPLWFGFAPVVLAALAVTLGGGLSGGLVFWVGNMLGEITPASEMLAPVVPTDMRFEWKILLGPSYFVTGLVASLAVLALVVLLAALVASLLRTGRVAPWLLLAAGVAAGATVLVAQLTGASAVMWWLVGASVVLGGAGVLAWRRNWKRERLPELVALDYGPGAGPARDPLGGGTDSDTVRKIVFQWRLARSKYRYHWVLGTVAAIGGLGVVMAGILSATGVQAGPDAVWSAGPVLLAAVTAAFVALGLRSWGNQKLRVTVGILWDLLAFWPRATHPLCPPPYGGRAVLELARRAADIAAPVSGGTSPVTETVDDATPDATKPGVAATVAGPRVVLCGHSQGSLVCLAAIAVLTVESAADGQHDGVEFITKGKAGKTLKALSLVTFGSQLQWAYARLFPRYAGYRVLTTMLGKIDDRWRNLHRWTDPLGGPVLAWSADGSPAPVGEAEAKHIWESVSGQYTVVPHDRRVGPDRRLLDPVRITTAANQVRAPLLGHGDYFADEEAFRCAVTEVTDG